MSNLKYFSIQVESDTRPRCFAARSKVELLAGLGGEDPVDNKNTLAYMRGYVLSSILLVSESEAKKAEFYDLFSNGSMSEGGQTPFGFDENNHPVYLGFID